MEECAIFDSPLEVESAFYQAFEQRDLAAMRCLWADDERAYCVHPLGARMNGMSEILAGWDLLFGQSADMHVSVAERQVIHTGDLVIHHLTELVHVVGQEPRQHWIAATNIYLRTDSGWRLLAHHASPALSDPVSPPVIH